MRCGQALLVTLAFFVVGVANVCLAPNAGARVCDGVTVPCTIGDTGPAGGIVFYDAGSTQPWGRYLEAAPPDWAENPITPAPTLEPSPTPPPTPTKPPKLAPSPPRQVSAQVRQQVATITWVKPSASGGSAISAYVVASVPVTKGCRTKRPTCEIGNLVPGESYLFSVKAINASGASAPSKPTRVQVPVPEQPAPKPTPSYLLMPKADPGPRTVWCPRPAPGSPNYAILGTGLEIGTGRANTALIMSSCGMSTAAGHAATYRGGGRDDWYLPARDELNQLFLRRSLVGSLADAAYWSSSQWINPQETRLSGFAWVQDFSTGGQGETSKDNGAFVRPIRAF